MPMFGVIKETFEREGGSIRGEDDFFSVASTTPLVASSHCQDACSRSEANLQTFDP